MRKLIVSSLVPLDGIHGDPQSWAGDYFDEQAAEASLAVRSTPSHRRQGHRPTCLHAITTGYAWNEHDLTASRERAYQAVRGCAAQPTSLTERSRHG